MKKAASKSTHNVYENNNYFEQEDAEKHSHLKFLALNLLKGALMHIWKSPYKFVFIWKLCPENFAFLILRIIELFAPGICKFLKK